MVFADQAGSVFFYMTQLQEGEQEKRSGQKITTLCLQTV